MVEGVAKTWWVWIPHFNPTPMAQKEEKRTKHACFKLCLSSWEWNENILCLANAKVDHCKPLESRLICYGICQLLCQGKDTSGHMLWVSLSRPSPKVTRLVTIFLLWLLITLLTSSPSEVLATVGCDASAQLFTISLTWTWLTPLTTSNSFTLTSLTASNL